MPKQPVVKELLSYSLEMPWRVIPRSLSRPPNSLHARASMGLLISEDLLPRPHEAVREAPRQLEIEGDYSGWLS